MAAEKDSKKGTDKEDKQKQILDLADAWKKMYFESESTLAKAIDEYVAGDSFTSFLEKMGAEYLSMYKTHNQNVERFFANSPIPSKKDIARVAELVLNIEEKADNLDMGVSEGFNQLAENMIKLVNFQAVIRDELLALRQEVQALQRQLQVEPLPVAVGTEKPAARTRNRKSASSKPLEESDVAAGQDSGASTVKVTSSRNRKKSPDKA